MRHYRKNRQLTLVLLLLWAALAVFGLSNSSMLRAEMQNKASVRRWVPNKVPAGAIFVGKQVCAECHQSKVAVQSESSMGRALELIEVARVLSSYDRLTYQDGKYSYEVVRQGKKSIYRVTDGKETIAEPILYSFGQGKAGQTYVLMHEGSYYESRISFYTDTMKLDLTLGYRETSPKSVVDAVGRKLSPDEIMQCLNCHSTGTVSGGEIHLDKLAPGVSCEACHGPGGDHAAAGKAGQPSKDKIFNPGRLSGDELSQEFCGSCHRSVEDLITRPQQGGLSNVRFQPYRIFSSKCYSDDRRISCIGCHDPHESVKHEAAYYDAKCAACHQTGRNTGSSGSSSQTEETNTARRCKVETKNCASCHMPKIDLPGAHFKFTDHRIRIVRPGEPYPF